MDLGNDDKLAMMVKLEEGIFLSADGEFFQLQIQDGDDSKIYYYSWVGEALRAFVTLSLKRFAKKTSDPQIVELVNKIAKLDLSINEVDKNITEGWETFVNDPIEMVINNRQRRSNARET